MWHLSKTVVYGIGHLFVSISTRGILLGGKGFLQIWILGKEYMLVSFLNLALGFGFFCMGG